MLDGLFSDVAPSFTTLTGAHKPEDVSSSAGGVHDLLAGAITALQAAVPPAAVASAHGDLVSALGSLNGVVFTTASEAYDAKICGGSSALSEITGSPGATQLRAAVKELATADPAHPYTVPAFLPDTTPQQNRQLANGTVIKKSTKGANVFTVENKEQRDAVVSLQPVSTKTAAVMLYIRAGAKAPVSGIHDGSYDIYITTGTDWDPQAKQFTRDCTYEHLDDPGKFTSNARQYSENTLTLSGGGNAPSTDAEPGEFPV